MIKSRYSAADLAAIGLKCLPSTRESIVRRAEREKWPYVEEPSQGRYGVRRMFEVPGYVRDELMADEAQKRSTEPTSIAQEGAKRFLDKQHQGAGQGAMGKTNQELTEIAALAVGRFFEEHGLRRQPEKEAMLVALMVRKFELEGYSEDAVTSLLKLVA